MLTSEAPSTALSAFAAAAESHRRIARQRRLTFLALVSPALLWFLAFMLWPLANMFYISLTHWDGLSLPQTFVWLDNYLRLARDPNIAVALRNTGLHLVAGLHERKADWEPSRTPDWVEVCRVEDIPEQRARVAMVGGIIVSSPLSYEAAASPGLIHTVRSASVEALRVRWPFGSAATKNQVS